jgi:ligand-binding SRPBCC domain-containing protein
MGAFAASVCPASNHVSMHHHFSAEQWLPYPVEQVFAFFGNPDNLPPLMPGWQKARIDKSDLQAPQPPGTGAAQNLKLAGAGTRMTLSFRPIPFSPIRATWDAEIDQFAWNDHFCDTQLRGPFAFWHHCHRVKREIRSMNGTTIDGTLLRDELEYELPLGILGELAHWIAVRRQIQSIFAFRHKRTAELLRG